MVEKDLIGTSGGGVVEELAGKSVFPHISSVSHVVSNVLGSVIGWSIFKRYKRVVGDEKQ